MTIEDEIKEIEELTKSLKNIRQSMEETVGILQDIKKGTGNGN